MRSTSRRAAVLLALAAAALAAQEVRAQQQAQGFAAERLSLDAAGGGWFVTDDLAMRGEPGGAASLTVGFAHRAVEIREGGQRLPVVQSQSFANVGLAVTYKVLRLYVNVPSPLYVAGRTGTVGAWQFTAPAANLEQNPDSVSDVQIGVNARLFGGPSSAVRLGAGAQLIVPSADRADYVTDGTYRGAARLMAAGDAGWFSYAAQVGVHIRPLNDAPVPGSPRGSELLFGVAAGARLPLGGGSVVLGPEGFGATALHSLFASSATALETLLTARYEGASSGSMQLAFKLGIGAGLHPQFGAPQWRAVAGVEVRGFVLPELSR